MQSKVLKPAEFDDQHGPPGMWVFRVAAKSGPVPKNSNTGSIQFQANKRHTLKIKLRTQLSPQLGRPSGHCADSQAVLH